ncbi:MAG: hypothetical protein KDB80_16830 [Planctomycetes bacterium]|nr:hypothetical protein [Planctomycetota bacterium]
MASSAMRYTVDRMRAPHRPVHMANPTAIRATDEFADLPRRDRSNRAPTPAHVPTFPPIDPWGEPLTTSRDP